MLKKFIAIFVLISITIALPVFGDIVRESDSVKAKYLLNWISSHVSSKTGMPLSFFIDKNSYQKSLGHIGLSDSVTGIIERTIVKEGISIYDAALWQIVLSQQEEKSLRDKALLPTKVYWAGRLGDMNNIRAGGFSKQSFIYDPRDFNRVSAELRDKGKRGFIFRILNANGQYLVDDPLDNKTLLEDFPNWSRLHWEDWKPIAGENAWVVIAAMHLYHSKYFDKETRTYHYEPGSPELLLARELARAAMILQAENGGVRMAPIGTYFFSLERPEGMPLDEFTRQYDLEGKKLEKKFNDYIDSMGFEEALLTSPQSNWYYYEQSTENNLSWYVAFRSLYQITRDERYSQAMEKIEGYLKSVWNTDGSYFYQGMHYIDGRWVPNEKHFAADVQTWGICKIGPAKIDRWFGKGASYRMWGSTKKISGVFHNGKTLGIGYSQEHARVSIEWSVGAMYAMHELAHYYARRDPDWAQSALADAESMRSFMEKYKTSVNENAAAYPYSTKREWIPFGWFSHRSEVLSLVSTCWVYLYDTKFNPFYIGSKRDYIFEDIIPGKEG